MGATLQEGITPAWTNYISSCRNSHPTGVIFSCRVTPASCTIYPRHALLFHNWLYHNNIHTKQHLTFSILKTSWSFRFSTKSSINPEKTSSTITTNTTTTTPSPSTTTTTTPSPSVQHQSTPAPSSKKKRKREDDQNFECELLKRFDSLDRPRDPSVCEMFGQEVARGCAEISDDYSRELVFRKIRDVIFEAKFPSSSFVIATSKSDMDYQLHNM